MIPRPSGPSSRDNYSYSNSNVSYQGQLMPGSQSFKKGRVSIATLAKIKFAGRKLLQSKDNGKKRAWIMKEWVETEENYRNDLDITVNIVKKSMLQEGLIDEEQSRVLFPEFESMLKLSNMMIDTLCKEMKPKPGSLDPRSGKYQVEPAMVGRELSKFAQGYKVYCTYFGNHTRIMSELEKLISINKDKLKQIEDLISKELERRKSKKQLMSIKDCIEQPLYRLFKYVLFLKEYKAKLTVFKLEKYNHPDYPYVSTCYDLFHETNNFNNELMKKKEDEAKRQQLGQIFGEAMRENRTLCAEIQASTIYYKCKLYVFNDLILMTKLVSILGMEREDKFAIFELNEFSEVRQQDDLKYFENILILLAKEQCIHLFFPSKDSKKEAYVRITAVIQDLKEKQYQRKRRGQSKALNKAKKIVFTLQQEATTPSNLLEPEFRVEVIGCEVRPLGTLSNDTVYITRFMIPPYYEDQMNFPLANLKSGELEPHTPLNKQEQLYADKDSRAKKQSSVPKCLNQVIEIHLSQLTQIYNEMKERTKQSLPEIDPTTKDINIYAKGTHKTKSYEMRKFLIEQYFNFVFRHSEIMKNPIWFISKLRISNKIWNYSTERNSCIKLETEQQKSYGFNHCSVCTRSNISSVEQFEKQRNMFRSRPNHRSNLDSGWYCTNSFNLLRNRVLEMKRQQFSSLQQILLFYHYFEGRIDYPFVLRDFDSREVLKKVKVYLPDVNERYMSVTIDHRSTAGELIEQLANELKTNSYMDLDLVVTYSGKTRILDRDEFISDLIRPLNIQFSEVEEGDRVREKNAGFFDNIKKWGKELISETVQSKIFLVKTTFLDRTRELKSARQDPAKVRLVLEQIMWCIRRGEIRVEKPEFAKVFSLYYCLKQSETIESFTRDKLNNKLLQKVIPDVYQHELQYQQRYRKEIAVAVEDQRKPYLDSSKSEYLIFERVMELVMPRVDCITYFVEVELKEPAHLAATREIGPMCLLGVNCREIVITKSENSRKAHRTLPLPKISVKLSVFSIFITTTADEEEVCYRFDGKMLVQMAQLIRKYLTIYTKV